MKTQESPGCPVSRPQDTARGAKGSSVDGPCDNAVGRACTLERTCSRGGRRRATKRGEVWPGKAEAALGHGPPAPGKEQPRVLGWEEKGPGPSALRDLKSEARSGGVETRRGQREGRTWQGLGLGLGLGRAFPFWIAPRTHLHLVPWRESHRKASRRGRAQLRGRRCQLLPACFPGAPWPRSWGAARDAHGPRLHPRHPA